jgi:hypothetical protein
MLKIGILPLFLFCALVAVAQEAIFPEPLSDRIASYDISVRLDAENKMLNADEIIRWKNPSDDTIREIQFHLYLNAFKNTQSTFNKEANPGFRQADVVKLKDEEWSWSHINKIEDEAGNDWTDFLEYVQPDDDNEYDETVIQLNLPRPVLPNDSITLKLNFTAKIPKVRVRTGYSNDFFLQVQWFPKVGVYEPAGMRFAEEGSWNCHQYHPTTEYYANFGEYNVDITVPDDYKVGASGVLYKETANEDGTRTFFFHGEDIIDFGWTASPDFMIVEDEWNHVKIRLFIIPDYDCCTDRYIQAAKNALEYFDERIMRYPFPTLTIVVPPFHGVNSGAMEYPTFITAPGMYKFPDWVRSPEYFVIHEFIHQYFQMMVATNEFEEAWMDEGFTSYYKSRIMDHYYGEKSSVIDLDFFHMGAMEFFRSRYNGMDNMSINNSVQFGWKYPFGSRARALFYSKPATWLKTLEGLLGIETMDEVMRSYFNRWKFNHPCRYDFIDVVNEVVAREKGDEFGPDMNWFFDQVLYGTDICDYAVANISNTLMPTFEAGIFEEKGMKAQKIDIDRPFRYESRVVLHRLGGIQLPVDVLIHFEDGTQKCERWNGKDRVFGFTYHGDQRIDYAIIDPDQKIYMDKNFLNNGLRIKPESKPIRRYITDLMIRLQHILQGISLLV